MLLHLYRRLRVPAFWITLVIVYVIATTPLLGSPTLGAGDKVNHMAAFLVLSWLGRSAYGHHPRWKLVVGLAIFGALIEVTQAIPMLHRDCSFADWIADCFAVLVGLATALPVERRLALRPTA